MTRKLLPALNYRDVTQVKTLASKTMITKRYCYLQVFDKAYHLSSRSETDYLAIRLYFECAKTVTRELYKGKLLQIYWCLADL